MTDKETGREALEEMRSMLREHREQQLDKVAAEYQRLPANFRATLAAAAGIPEPLRTTPLDKLSGHHRRALREAAGRLAALVGEAMPLLSMSILD